MKENYVDLRTFAENQKRRIIDDYVNVLRNKVSDLSRVIWDENSTDVFADQYNGKVVPFAYTRVFGPITPANASLSDYILPSKPMSNIVIGREGSFTWEETAVVAIAQESIGAIVPDPGPGTTPPANGDLFDSYFYNNGGGTFNRPSTGSVSSTNSSNQAVGFDIQLYDKKRGRSLHDGKIPYEIFFGQHVTNKILAEPLRMDPNTNLEPRLYITWPQFSQLSNNSYGTDGEDGFYQTDISWWIAMTFKGYLSIES